MRNEIHRSGRRLPWFGVFAGLLLSATASADDMTPLKERLELCSGCHNMDGNAVIPDHPKLSGLDSRYIARQLRDFKSGARPGPVMSGIVQMLDESEFDGLAAYFSEQTRSSGAASDAKLAAQGKDIFDNGITGSAVPACSGCHNDDGSGDDKYPRLNGQNSAYVAKQLLDFKSGARSNDMKGMMRKVASRMNEQEIKAVAEYIVTLKEEAGE